MVEREPTAISFTKRKKKTKDLATSCGLNAKEFDSRRGQKHSSLLHTVQIGSGAYSIAIANSFTEGKAAGA
jgi:hypothetical protein